MINSVILVTLYVQLYFVSEKNEMALLEMIKDNCCQVTHLVTAHRFEAEADVSVSRDEQSRSSVNSLQPLNCISI